MNQQVVEVDVFELNKTRRVPCTHPFTSSGKFKYIIQLLASFMQNLKKPEKMHLITPNWEKRLFGKFVLLNCYVIVCESIRLLST